MLEEEIVKNNELIAEFIGRRGVNKKYLYTFPKVDKLLNGDIWYTISGAEFHKSWDWLMPVVEKIETIKTGELEDVTFDVVIIENSCQIGAIMTDIADFTKESKIKATYLAVIQFIKWYNEYRS